MEGKKFQRRKEDFVCDQCGFFVEGNGYTNHCPKCLWGRHVDVFPGDRADLCKGMMEPINILLKKGESFVVHRCVSCGYETKNRISEHDDRDQIIYILKKNSDQLFRY